MTNMQIVSDIGDTIGVINMAPMVKLPLRYVLFTTKYYEYNGGAYDFCGKFATIQEGINHYHRYGYRYGHIADIDDNFKILWMSS